MPFLGKGRTLHRPRGGGRTMWLWSGCDVGNGPRLVGRCKGTSLQNAALPVLLATLSAGMVFADGTRGLLRCGNIGDAICSSRLLKLPGFGAAPALAFAHRFPGRIFHFGTPCFSSMAGGTGIRRGHARRFSPSALAFAGTGRCLPLVAACCRRPGNGRLLAAVGVSHVSVHCAARNDSRSRRSLDFRWADFTSAVRFRQILFAPRPNA